ncbi:hypothetical protein KP509_04G098900 [Ceratopteris richardii]|uniref:pectinesterase n=1 Tax=Ceratopteris richardii TaxID=49495 RepID=A0A8T2UYG2_CERRI|nr:hypothetical protein KP509_04G098900 [Ceratopteris richardii]
MDSKSLPRHYVPITRLLFVILVACPPHVVLGENKSSNASFNSSDHMDEKEQDFIKWVARVGNQFYSGSYSGDQVGKNRLSGIKSVGYTLTVGKSGSGAQFLTVQDAVDAVPKHNSQRIIIQIGPGIYKEKVHVPSSKPYITFQGAGASSTTITWHDTEASTGALAKSASVSIDSRGFIARDMTFEKCELRTVLRSTQSLTAQKRAKPSENTGFSFVDCKVTGEGMAYLGRAWGPYSRVVFSYTYMDDIIKPQGWHNWDDSSREHKVFFGQYKCSGPGAEQSERVGWSRELSDTEAAPFQSVSFIDGASWLES